VDDVAREKRALAEIRRRLQGKTIHVIPYMHADWAWCHTRIWHEIRYCTSIAENIEVCERMPDYRFYLDCWRTVMVPLLERRPDMVGALRRLIAAGKAAVCGTFSNVRPNMVDGEAFIRNMVIGRRLWQGLFPEAELSVHADAVDVALGHPQMPQLLTKAGYRYFRAGRPFDLLQRKGLPRSFTWQGLDGSRILTWGSVYGSFFMPENIGRIFVEDWTESVETAYELELRDVVETAVSRNLDIHQGCDDSLPLCGHNCDTPMPLPELMRRWNERETSTMRFSTPIEFFRELEAEGVSPTVTGTLDPCDVSYNVAWGGETGIVARRIQGSELLSAAERMTAGAHLAGAAGWQDTTELWKDNLTASAHATQWLFECDIAEISAYADRPITYAREQLRRVARSLVERIPLPGNAVITAFNPYGQDVIAPLVFTVTCGEIATLRLVDGEGRALPFQPVNSYEYTHTIWEYDVAVMLRIPAHGWNTVVAAAGRIDCRSSGEFMPPPKPTVLSVGEHPSFSLDAGRLRLDFERGNLVSVTDLERSSTVAPPSTIPWNHVSYVHIDTSRGTLHCGPILARHSARWDRYSLVEQGPVRWLVRLWGSIGARRFLQEIRVHAGDNRIYFATETITDEELEGYLTFGIPGRGDTLQGGINFGMEKKAVLEELYFAHDDPGRDDHRLREGLFFAKDFAVYEHGFSRVMLAPKQGDRYFLFDKASGELAYIHLGTTKIDPEGWERNVNAAMLHAAGTHRFEDMIVIDSAERPAHESVNLAYAYRLDPILLRPVHRPDSSTLLELTGSLIRVDATNVQISAAIVEGDSLLVRLWESAGRPTETRLSLPRQTREARAEDFIGRPDPSARVSLDRGSVWVTLRPWEILTIRCRVS
jgi:hypothetical protein